MDNDEVHIAGWNTANDWRSLRAQLTPAGTKQSWESAFRNYLVQRLEKRYLKPIAILQRNGSYDGEGFSIVAIQCTLIEFLESTIRGMNFVRLEKNQQLKEFEYTSSREMFVAFLRDRDPFAKTFNDASARDFYAGVRCGLLHEARTKNDWTIWAKSPDGRVADTAEKVIYRDNFQEALLAFIKAYGERLVQDAAYQEAFIRKFDKLCE